MGTMFDTTDDPATTLVGLQVEAIAAYANGKFANYGAAAREFPSVHLLEVDVNGQQVGNAGDFEAGDMPYSEAGPWAKARLSQGVARPVVYFQVSSWAVSRAVTRERRRLQERRSPVDGALHRPAAHVLVGVWLRSDRRRGRDAVGLVRCARDRPERISESKHRCVDHCR